MLCRKTFVHFIKIENVNAPLASLLMLLFHSAHSTSLPIVQESGCQVLFPRSCVRTAPVPYDDVSSATFVFVELEHNYGELGSGLKHEHPVILLILTHFFIRVVL